MIREPTATDRQLASASGLNRHLRIIAITVTLFVMLVAVSSWLWSSSTRSVDGQRLRIGEVTRGTLIRDAAVNGRAVAAVSPTLYAPIDGTVTLTVQAGDTVKVGQLLATIDSPQLQAERDRESATLAELLADLDRQQIAAKKQQLLAQRDADEAKLALIATTRDRERMQQACAREIIAKVECVKADDSVEAANIRSGHAQRNAQLESQNVGFEYKSLVQRVSRQQSIVKELDRRINGLAIRAPVSGLIGSIAIADRAVVTANAALLTVVDLSRLEAELEVPERYADDLGLGMRVELQINDQRVWGKLASIAPEVLANQVLARVRFDGEQPPGLRQNQRLSARIVIEEKSDVLLAPRGPFVEALGGRQAYVVNADLATRKSIEIGAVSVSAVEVLSGLNAGDRIVIAGTEQFNNAPSIRIRQ